VIVADVFYSLPPQLPLSLDGGELVVVDSLRRLIRLPPKHGLPPNVEPPVWLALVPRRWPPPRFLFIAAERPVRRGKIVHHLTDLQFVAPRGWGGAVYVAMVDGAGRRRHHVTYPDRVSRNIVLLSPPVPVDNEEKVFAVVVPVPAEDGNGVYAKLDRQPQALGIPL